ncbi:MAG TPA: 4'-phosphopantetheinyl transferase superfamily protein [Trichocoleus sp.]
MGSQADNFWNQAGKVLKHEELSLDGQGTFSLEPGHIHIWQFHLPQIQKYLDDWVAYLCPEECDRMARFVFERDRIKYGLSRGGLRQLLGRYVEQDPASLDFEYEAKGKPHLYLNGKRHPLQFNLSHSGDWVVYGVSCDRPLGIDIEQIRPLRNLHSLAQHCLTPIECQDLFESVEADHSKFFEYWTSKEAYLKATGQGLTHSMTNVKADLAAAQILPEPHNPNFDFEWHLHRWVPAVGYTAAVVYPGNSCTLQHQEYAALFPP